ncbi:hypothetical protein [Kineococcus sp. SYSU DK005]|uniref:hypothetical protein n=1 Tax=Kineococcus sp. SYSU DK005 TaxID=3383126 RepID=UPI003D7EAA89
MAERPGHPGRPSAPARRDGGLLVLGVLVLLAGTALHALATWSRPDGADPLGVPAVLRQWWWLLRWVAWGGVVGGVWLTVRGWSGRSARGDDPGA